MKVGDKVYCFKTINLNIKGTYYTILELTGNGILLTTDDDPTKTLNSNRHFFIHTQIDHWSKFSDHFNELRIERKMKLNKLFSL